ncbi:MAG: C10 family peptidase [Bacteroidaceae bacterium]
MKRIFSLFLMVLTATSFVDAQPVSEQAAMLVAQQFAVSGPVSCRSVSRDQISVTLSYTAKTGRLNDFYVFNYGDENGFVIVSADLRTKQSVLAYSDQGSFDDEFIPSNVEKVLASYQEQIEAVRHNRAGAAVQSGHNGVPEVIVKPLITTVWDQDPPFNLLCPIDKETGLRSLTGCMATAMAQTMNYWEWPASGQGLHFNTRDTTLCVNFDESVYDWDNMIEDYSLGGTAEQEAAVQRLMYDCGIAINTTYGSSASAAYLSDVQKAIITYFDYASSAKMIQHKDCESEWDNILKQELDAGRPILYGGYTLDRTIGHAFICDGYDSQDYFHYNFGWNGYCDGFYLSSAIDLKEIDVNFSSNMLAVIGIVPDYDDTCRDGDGIFELYGDYAVFRGIIHAYDSVRVLTIPEKAVIDGKTYPVGIIETYSFFCNKYISGLLIPASVYQIGDYAFYGCSRLKEVVVPPSLVYLNGGIFGSCNNMEHLSVSLGNPHFDSRNNCNAIIETKTDRLVQGCNYTVVPDGVVTIGANAFEAFDGIVTVRLPGSVINIELEAYYGCSSLKNVFLHDGIEAVGASAFEGCTLLKDIYSYAKTPPQIQSSTFPEGCTVHVMPGFGDKYRADYFWRGFNIVEDLNPDPTAVIPVPDDGQPRYYDLKGNPASYGSKGLRIGNGRKYYLN